MRKAIIAQTVDSTIDEEHAFGQAAWLPRADVYILTAQLNW
jgi:hypothetical protein